MNTAPLRRKYGVSPSLIGAMIILFVILLALNVFASGQEKFGSSFYGYWLSGRVLFAQGGDPYSSVLYEQLREKFPDEPNLAGFTLPLYAIIPVLPFTLINNFRIAFVIWMFAIEAAMVAAAFRISEYLRVRQSSGEQNLIIVAMMVCFYSVTTLLDGDIAPLAILCLVLAVCAVRDGETELAGIMLAFATIKYNITLLPVIWICIWCLRNRRGGIVGWMSLILVLLFLISMLFMTNWFVEFLRASVHYIKYRNPINLAGIITNWQPELGGRIGWAVSGILLAIMLLEWILNARGSEDTYDWVLFMTITVSFLTGAPNIGKNLCALTLPITYTMQQMIRRWEKKGLIYSLILGIAFLVIPWVFQILVAYNLWDPISVLNLVFPAVVLFLLYWNRWWIIDTFIEKY